MDMTRREEYMAKRVMVIDVLGKRRKNRMNGQYQV